MAQVLNLILSVGFAAAMAGAVHLWRRHMEAARRDDLQAMAARRGWSLTITDQRLGRAGSLRIASRGGHRWVAETRADAPVADPPAARTRQATEYEAAEPAWADGTLLVVLARPDPGGTPPNSRARARLLGDDLARQVAPFDWWPAPDGLLVVASADPSRRVDLADIGRVLGEWRPLASGERGAPVLVLSPAGLRLRVRHRIARADQMERFIDLALSLSRLIGP